MLETDGKDPVERERLNVQGIKGTVDVAEFLRGQKGKARRTGCLWKEVKRPYCIGRKAGKWT
jgi:hypothetical protein